MAPFAAWFLQYSGGTALPRDGFLTPERCSKVAKLSLLGRSSPQAAEHNNLADRR
jgi:hypothetical protein